MKTFVYKPEGLEGVSGEIELKRPSPDERLEFAELFTQKLDQDENLHQIKLIRKMIPWSAKFYVKVDLVLGEEKVQSFDSLYEHPDASEVLSLVVDEIAKRMSVSKKK